jgi:hypothetical protein
MARTCRFLLQGQGNDTDRDHLGTPQAASLVEYVMNISYHHTVVTIMLTSFVQAASVTFPSLSARDCNTLKWATEAVGHFRAGAGGRGDTFCGDQRLRQCYSWPARQIPVNKHYSVKENCR